MDNAPKNGSSPAPLVVSPQQREFMRQKIKPKCDHPECPASPDVFVGFKLFPPRLTGMPTVTPPRLAMTGIQVCRAHLPAEIGEVIGPAMWQQLCADAMRTQGLPPDYERTQLHFEVIQRIVLL